MHTKMTEVNLTAFIHRLFHEDFSPILRTNPEVTDRRISDMNVCLHLQYLLSCLP